MKISILNRFSASVIFAADIENNTVKLTLELALKSGADLRGANLYGADLRGVNLDGEKLTKTPLQLNNLKWFVLISDSYLRIGCQRHLISDWEKFKDGEIEKMASGALDFWKKWKNSILTICKAHSESEES